MNLRFGYLRLCYCTELWSQQFLIYVILLIQGSAHPIPSTCLEYRFHTNTYGSFYVTS